MFSLLVIPCASLAQVSHLVIGQGGLDWREFAIETVGIDSSVRESLQPFELDPAANIAVGPVTEGGALLGPGPRRLRAGGETVAGVIGTNPIPFARQGQRFWAMCRPE